MSIADVASEVEGYPMGGDKSRDVLDGALQVFARDGYSRASIGELAAAAGVSTRTIYNQYENKAGLFRAVILDSATRVADRQIAKLERLFGRITDVRRDLVSFGTAWSVTDPDTDTHFAMVRQIGADREHIDPDTLAAWRAAGPDRVTDALASHLRRLCDDGPLRIDDTRLAARQLVQLTAGVASSVGVASDDVSAIAEAGVDVFLAAYGVPNRK